MLIIKLAHYMLYCIVLNILTLTPKYVYYKKKDNQFLDNLLHYNHLAFKWLQCDIFLRLIKFPKTVRPSRTAGQTYVRQDNIGCWN